MAVSASPQWTRCLVAETLLALLLVPGAQARETCNQGRPECDDYISSCPDSDYFFYRTKCCRQQSPASNPFLCDDSCCDVNHAGHIAGVTVAIVLFVLIVGGLIYCGLAGVLCFESTREEVERSRRPKHVDVEHHHHHQEQPQQQPYTRPYQQPQPVPPPQQQHPPPPPYAQPTAPPAPSSHPVTKQG